MAVSTRCRAQDAVAFQYMSSLCTVSKFVLSTNKKHLMSIRSFCHHPFFKLCWFAFELSGWSDPDETKSKYYRVNIYQFDLNTNPKVSFKLCVNCNWLKSVSLIEIQHHQTIADRHQESKSCDKMLFISSSGFDWISTKYTINWVNDKHSASSIFRTREAAVKEVEGDWSCCH